MNNLIKKLSTCDLSRDQMLPLLEPHLSKKHKNTELAWVEVAKRILTRAADVGSEVLLRNASTFIKMHLDGMVRRGLKNPNRFSQKYSDALNSLLTHLHFTMEDTSLPVMEMHNLSSLILAAIIDTSIVSHKKGEESSVVSKIFMKLTLVFGHFQEQLLDALLHCRTLIHPSSRQPAVQVPLIKRLFSTLRCPKSTSPELYLKYLLLGKLWLFMTEKKELGKTRTYIAKVLRVPEGVPEWAERRGVPWLTLPQLNTRLILKNMTLAGALETFYGRHKNTSGSCDQLEKRKKKKQLTASSVRNEPEPSKPTKNSEETKVNTEDTYDTIKIELGESLLTASVSNLESDEDVEEKVKAENMSDTFDTDKLHGTSDLELESDEDVEGKVKTENVSGTLNAETDKKLVSASVLELDSEEDEKQELQAFGVRKHVSSDGVLSCSERTKQKGRGQIKQKPVESLEQKGKKRKAQNHIEINESSAELTQKRKKRRHRTELKVSDTGCRETKKVAKLVNNEKFNKTKLEALDTDYRETKSKTKTVSKNSGKPLSAPDFTSGTEDAATSTNFIHKTEEQSGELEHPHKLKSQKRPRDPAVDQDSSRGKIRRQDQFAKVCGVSLETAGEEEKKTLPRLHQLLKRLQRIRKNSMTFTVTDLEVERSKRELKDDSEELCVNESSGWEVVNVMQTDSGGGGVSGKKGADVLRKMSGSPNPELNLEVISASECNKLHHISFDKQDSSSEDSSDYDRSDDGETKALPEDSAWGRRQEKSTSKENIDGNEHHPEELLNSSNESTEEESDDEVVSEAENIPVPTPEKEFCVSHEVHSGSSEADSDVDNNSREEPETEFGNTESDVPDSEKEKNAVINLENRSNASKVGAECDNLFIASNKSDIIADINNSSVGSASEKRLKQVSNDSNTSEEASDDKSESDNEITFTECRETKPNRGEETNLDISSEKTIDLCTSGHDESDECCILGTEKVKVKQENSGHGKVYKTQDSEILHSSHTLAAPDSEPEIEVLFDEVTSVTGPVHHQAVCGGDLKPCDRLKEEAVQREVERILKEDEEELKKQKAINRASSIIEKATDSPKSLLPDKSGKRRDDGAQDPVSKMMNNLYKSKVVENDSGGKGDGDIGVEDTEVLKTQLSNDAAVSSEDSVGQLKEPLAPTLDGEDDSKSVEIMECEEEIDSVLENIVQDTGRITSIQGLRERLLSESSVKEELRETTNHEEEKEDKEMRESTDHEEEEEDEETRESTNDKEEKEDKETRQSTNDKEEKEDKETRESTNDEEKKEDKETRESTNDKEEQEDKETRESTNDEEEKEDRETRESTNDKEEQEDKETRESTNNEEEKEDKETRESTNHEKEKEDKETRESTNHEEEQEDKEIEETINHEEENEEDKELREATNHEQEKEEKELRERTNHNDKKKDEELRESTNPKEEEEEDKEVVKDSEVSPQHDPQGKTYDSLMPPLNESLAGTPYGDVKPEEPVDNEEDDESLVRSIVKDKGRLAGIRELRERLLSKTPVKEEVMEMTHQEAEGDDKEVRECLLSTSDSQNKTAEENCKDKQSEEVSVCEAVLSNIKCSPDKRLTDDIDIKDESLDEMSLGEEAGDIADGRKDTGTSNTEQEQLEGGGNCNDGGHIQSQSAVPPCTNLDIESKENDLLSSNGVEERDNTSLQTSEAVTTDKNGLEGLPIANGSTVGSIALGDDESNTELDLVKEELVEKSPVANSSMIGSIALEGDGSNAELESVMEESGGKINDGADEAYEASSDASEDSGPRTRRRSRPLRKSCAHQDPQRASDSDSSPVRAVCQRTFALDTAGHQRLRRKRSQSCTLENVIPGLEHHDRRQTEQSCGNKTFVMEKEHSFNRTFTVKARKFSYSESSGTSKAACDFLGEKGFVTPTKSNQDTSTTQSDIDASAKGRKPSTGVPQLHKSASDLPQVNQRRGSRDSESQLKVCTSVNKAPPTDAAENPCSTSSGTQQNRESLGILSLIEECISPSSEKSTEPFDDASSPCKANVDDTDHVKGPSAVEEPTLRLRLSEDESAVPFSLNSSPSENSNTDIETQKSSSLSEGERRKSLKKINETENGELCTKAQQLDTCDTHNLAGSARHNRSKHQDTIKENDRIENNVDNEVNEEMAEEFFEGEEMEVLSTSGIEEEDEEEVVRVTPEALDDDDDGAAEAKKLDLLISKKSLRSHIRQLYLSKDGKEVNSEAGSRDRKLAQIPVVKAQCLSEVALTKEVLISPDVSDEECELVSPGIDFQAVKYPIEEDDLEDAVHHKHTTSLHLLNPSLQKSSGGIHSPHKTIPEEQDESTVPRDTDSSSIKTSSLKKVKNSNKSSSLSTQLTPHKAVPEEQDEGTVSRNASENLPKTSSVKKGKSSSNSPSLSSQTTPHKATAEEQDESSLPENTKEDLHKTFSAKKGKGSSSTPPSLFIQMMPHNTIPEEQDESTVPRNTDRDLPKTSSVKKGRSSSSNPPSFSSQMMPHKTTPQEQDKSTVPRTTGEDLNKSSSVKKGRSPTTPPSLSTPKKLPERRIHTRRSSRGMLGDGSLSSPQRSEMLKSATNHTKTPKASSSTTQEEGSVTLGPDHVLDASSKPSDTAQCWEKNNSAGDSGEDSGSMLFKNDKGSRVKGLYSDPPSSASLSRKEPKDRRSSTHERSLTYAQNQNAELSSEDTSDGDHPEKCQQVKSQITRSSLDSTSREEHEVDKKGRKNRLPSLSEEAEEISGSSASHQSAVKTFRGRSSSSSSSSSQPLTPIRRSSRLMKHTSGSSSLTKDTKNHDSSSVSSESEVETLEAEDKRAAPSTSTGYRRSTRTATTLRKTHGKGD